MTRTIRTLIVDDEPLARRGLRARLLREADFDVVGEAEDGPSAAAAIIALKPDLVFLDVQMPGFDGFDALSRAATAHLPHVVFVTAFDKYALRAFAVHALDYLLKPIAHRRFQESLRRARAEFDKHTHAESAERLRAMLDARDTEREGSKEAALAHRLTVRQGERFILLKVADVDWIEADANYLKLHAAGRAFQLRMTMAEVERQLDPRRFARIHRSAIVNLDRVTAIEPEWHGEYRVSLSTGARLRLSRSFRDRLLGRRRAGP